MLGKIGQLQCNAEGVYGESTLSILSKKWMIWRGWPWAVPGFSRNDAKIRIIGTLSLLWRVHVGLCLAFRPIL